ncbi:MAG TPA: TetR family transcriptional regulator [Actinomycetes bacterium]|jgi:AcrR family transcriptional regulator|nr:TetR family transcriptional regulator [Actinomycetes bacterium]
MRIATEDRKTAAIIRDAAMELFAERGTSGVTVREIASKAGVSPGLVTHHFGTKAGLKEAVDRRVSQEFGEMLAQLDHIGQQGAGTSLAALFADRLDREPALAGYVRRLLVDGGEPADSLFAQMFETTLTGMRSLARAGIVRPADDEHVRAAFLLANDLAMVLLRRQIEHVAGIDPLAGEGLIRWSAEVLDVYAKGLFTSSVPTPAPAPASRLPGSPR